MCQYAKPVFTIFLSYIMPIIHLIMHYETKAATSSFLTGTLIPHWKNNPLHYNILQIIVLHPAGHILDALVTLLHGSESG